MESDSCQGEAAQNDGGKKGRGFDGRLLVLENTNTVEESLFPRLRAEQHTFGAGGFLVHGEGLCRARHGTGENAEIDDEGKGLHLDRRRESNLHDHPRDLQKLGSCPMPG